MNLLIFGFTIIFSTRAEPVGLRSAAGWSTTTTLPPTTTGWSTTTTPPPTTGWSTTTTPSPTTGWTTTEGWSTTTSPPSPGWSTTSGWGTLSTSEDDHQDKVGWGTPGHVPHVNVELTSDLAAVGAGVAAEGHSESIHVSGDSNVPADVSMGAGGDIYLDQQGTAIQSSDINPNTGLVNTVNHVSVSQSGASSEGMTIDAQGLEVLVEQDGWADISGSGAAAADANTSILVNKGA